jgi:hypothetical protein
MTSMMLDLETRKTEMDMYRTQSHRGNPFGVQFTVQVLQHGAWEVDKNKFDKFNVPVFLDKCVNDFNTFYINRHKTHKLLWCFGIGNLEMQYLYLKKPYQSVSTLAQYSLLCVLEKYEKMKVEKIAEVLGYNVGILINDANGLLYHIAFNPKKQKNMGLIYSDAAEGVDIKPENEIWINKDFQATNLRFNSIPVVFKVILFLFNYIKIVETSRTG